MAAGRLAGTNLLLLLALGAVWGTAFLFITIGLDAFSPVLFAALRFDIAGLFVLAIALARKANLRPSGAGQWRAILVAAVLNVGCYHAFLFWGQQFTNEVVASVIVGLNPIVTTFFARLLLTDERVGWGGVVGLALGLGGVIALAALKGGSLLDARGVGELAIVAAIASWSMGSILVRRSKHGMDVFAFTAWQMLVGAVLLHITSLALERGNARADWSAGGVVSLLYLAIVSSGFGFLVYFTLLDRVGPIRSNLVSHIAPIFAALAGVIYFREGIEVRALVAFGLIVAGFGLVARRAPPAEPVRVDTT